MTRPAVLFFALCLAGLTASKAEDLEALFEKRRQEIAPTPTPTPRPTPTQAPARSSEQPTARPTESPRSGPRPQARQEPTARPAESPRSGPAAPLKKPTDRTLNPGDRLEGPWFLERSGRHIRAKRENPIAEGFGRLFRIHPEHAHEITSSRYATLEVVERASMGVVYLKP